MMLARAVWVGLVVLNSSALGLRADEHAPTLRAVSSGSHLWIALPTSGGCTILHHSPAMGGWFFREVTKLPVLPTALAARANRLWIATDPADPSAATPVYSLSTERNPATGSFFYTPTGRLDVLPSIPPGTVLSGVAPEGDGPCALVAAPALELLHSTPTGWAVERLSSEVGSSAALVAWPRADRSQCALLRVDGEDLVSFVPRNPGDASAWERSAWPGAGIGFTLFITGSARPATLSRESPTEFVVQYLTPTGPRRLAVVPSSEDLWSVVGLDEGFQLVSADSTGGVSLAHIDPLTGSIAEAHPLVAQPSETGEWIHLPLLGALTIGMLLAGFILHPPLNAPERLPAPWVALPPARRVVALGIDLIPGAIVALAVTGAHLEELLAMPSWTPDLARATPSSIMLGVTGVWCLLFEITLRATPGKFIVGGRVVLAPDGTNDRRAGAGRAAARALFKMVVLFAPALGFLAFVHPTHQGLPETLTKTIVARRSG